ncbi:MAG: hypothetical protein JRI22_16605 [Deltaproteobacteria bacterium]|nr:hypothetical protein [Deltaproteobacteria bacterium]
MEIKKIEVYRLKLPLKKPYHIALGDISHFDTMITLAHADGKMGVGETTPLEEYSWESVEGIWRIVRQLGAEIVGKELTEAKQAVSARSRSDPFAVTTLMTALEALEDVELLRPPETMVGVEILGILNETALDGIERAVPELLDSGFRTIKFKVGFNVQEDIEKVRFIQNLLGGRARLRLDANQSYTFENAQRFGKNVDPAGIELLEQPLKPDDWGGMVRLSRDYPLPLMLDEAIYSMDEIERAGQLRCTRFIKLKLMKCGGVQRFAREINRVRELGMDIIIGNGVAADIGCYHEALISYHLDLPNAGEMNGFLKPMDAVVDPRLRFENGTIVLDSAAPPRIVREKLESLAVDSAAWTA